jgi:hypothetical protein
MAKKRETKKGKKNRLIALPHKRNKKALNKKAKKQTKIILGENEKECNIYFTIFIRFVLIFLCIFIFMSLFFVINLFRFLNLVFTHIYLHYFTENVRCQL